MQESIRKQLVDLNKQLYTKGAEEFSNSRSYYWSGWERMLELIGEELPRKLSILDLGCGNGRFGSFMKERGYEIEYTGVDNSKELLMITEKTLQVSGVQLDLASDHQQLNGSYDLIVLFGVLHHIPGRKQRGELMKKVVGLLKEDSLAVFTTWNFQNDKRLQNRVIGPEKVGISQGELEKGDHLIEWNRGIESLRYVHDFDDREVDELIAISEGDLCMRFDADGRSGKLNTYYILGK